VQSGDQANPFRRPLTLGDWHFVFGLPVKPVEYTTSAANGGFALVGGYTDWREYEVALDQTRMVLQQFAAAGLNVAWGPPPWVFYSLMRHRNAVIVLTHAAKETETHDGAFEFQGKMVPFRRVVSKASPDFAGIVDICACEADAIQGPLKRRAPGCATKVAKRKLTLGFWVAYYAEFLRLFAPGPTTYYEAIMRARDLI
jgi:hypothetical protein